MKLRFGFLGLGAMGFSHLNSFARLCGGEVEISAVCSSNENNLRKARELAPDLRVCASAEELVGLPLDAVIVSTPNFTHVPLAREILRAGKHLFLEKPCGINREECRALVEMADKTDRIILIGHELRYSPFFQKIHDLVKSGEVGRPRMVWTREFRGPFQKKSQNWIQDERRSGGMLVDKNCHHFDLMNWWVGARPRRVSAFGSNAVNRVLEGPHQVNDHATVNFEYENGVVGTLQICLFALDFPHEDLEMGVVGEGGVLQTRVSQIEILQWKKGSGAREPLVHKVQAKAGEGWGNHLGFDEIHREFVECLRSNRKPLTGVRDCLEATLLAIAAEESIKGGQTVLV